MLLPGSPDIFKHRAKVNREPASVPPHVMFANAASRSPINLSCFLAPVLERCKKASERSLNLWRPLTARRPSTRRMLACTCFGDEKLFLLSSFSSWSLETAVVLVKSSHLRRRPSPPQSLGDGSTLECFVQINFSETIGDKRRCVKGLKLCHLCLR